MGETPVARKPKIAAEPQPPPDPAAEPVVEVRSIKGFDQNWKCRDFQYEVGKSYELDGEIEVCNRGFHACDAAHHPFSVFHYYLPTSRFADVVQSGAISRSGDAKIASARITIEAEIKLPDLIRRAIDWVFAQATPEAGSQATGDRGAASATGDQGAASATGDRGAASATGDRGAASATGIQGAASATGDRGAASATGDRGAASATGYRGAASATGDRGAASATGIRGAASATGDQGAASATGYQGRAQGTEGNALFLVYRDDNQDITHVWAGIVGQNGIKPLVWYMLDEHGVPQEVV